VFEPRPDWPDHLPPEPAEARLADAGLLDAAGDLDHALRASLGWSLLLADRDEQIEHHAVAVRSFSHAAVGLLDDQVDGDLGHYPPFGVILYADGPAESDDVTGHVGVIEFGEQKFLVVVRRGTYEPHSGTGPVAVVAGGTAAYRATSRAGRHSGWLTARHVADTAAFAAAGHTVLDRASHCIDAAVVDLGAGYGHLQPAPAHRTLMAGLTIAMPFAPAGATVLDVTGNMRISGSWKFPLRFNTSVAGRPGDSGSAIEETQTAARAPLGIYLGAYTPDTPYPGHVGQAGVGLSIHQLEVLMDLEVFR
jgi:hypothetical protein